MRSQLICKAPSLSPPPWNFTYSDLNCCTGRQLTATCVCVWQPQCWKACGNIYALASSCLPSKIEASMLTSHYSSTEESSHSLQDISISDSEDSSSGTNRRRAAAGRCIRTIRAVLFAAPTSTLSLKPALSAAAINSAASPGRPGTFQAFDCCASGCLSLTAGERLPRLRADPNLHRHFRSLRCNIPRSG